MFLRTDLEIREATTLAPYATFSAAAQRKYPEDTSRTRTAFQKDRDRVLHTTAFRRLEAKTQLFLNARGDHYRTRLTHTLEVQQVARSVALNLGLNETLAETVALAHDLGHPPFGHAGERILNALMAEHGGFDHNLQAHRIVTHLEDRYPHHPGLNLTLDTLDGLNKHHRSGLGQPGLEAQVVDLADALAYTAHDLDDGLRSGMIQNHELAGLGLWQKLRDQLGLRGSDLDTLDRRLLHRELLSWLIDELTTSSDQSIRQSGVQSAADVHAQPQKLIEYSPETRSLLRETKAFMAQKLYHHWRVEMQVEQATRVLETLFHAFMQRPAMLPPRPRRREQADGLPRTICDHLAGMTDRYALEIYWSLVPAVP
ncbi:dGTP triphosphohydrolase [Deinococcus sp.]|uniref:dGTP triphosphohydrolase n=1 Tax=Deinococcus sp. TaxID=47478 RepID=UPI0025B91C7B|nr:dNTP triphosphohydrolase [Deinococcus sp.]